MDTVQRIIEREEAFWKGDEQFYRTNLTEGAIMVFPEPAGILTRDQVLEGIASGPRWRVIEFETVSASELHEDVILLAYRASAKREEGPGYTTLASSVYVRSQGAWLLTFHQQTPVPSA